MSTPRTSHDTATYSLSEVAEILGIGETHVRKMAHEGAITDEFSGHEVPVIKLGRRYLVSRRALHAFISATQGYDA